MQNNDRNSETAEIDEILEEVRRYRTGVTPSQEVKEQKEKSVNLMQDAEEVTIYTPKTKPQEKMVDISNAFIVYDDTEENDKNKKTKNVKSCKGAKKSKKKGVLFTVASVVLALVLCMGFCGFTFLGELKYADNVYVNDICIGGMNHEEAQKILSKEEAKIAKNIKVNVTAGEKSTTINGEDLTYTFNTEKVLQQAKLYSKHNPFAKGERKFTIAIEVDNNCLKKVSQKVATDLNQKPIDAKVTKFYSSKKGADRFTFEEAKSGMEINKEVFENQFETFFSNGKVSGDIEAATTSTESACTKEYLLKNIKELSSYTTTANAVGSENSNSNMKLAASMCNNSIINPGEVWSFNECTGDSTLESRGFKAANIYVNGELTKGVGGGICQTSSTIYNAGLYCGLDVVERLPHAYPSTYVPVGLDATIDYGNIDLKLINNFDYQIFMECYMDGLEVVCKLYGLENPNFDEVKLTSQATSSSTASATRTFYKNGKKVSGDKVPYEELPSSNYISIDGSSSGGSSSDTYSQYEDTPAIPQIPDDPQLETEPEYEPESQPETVPEADLDTEVDTDII